MAWVTDISHLSKMAAPQPQAAYASFTKSLQCEWQCIVPDCRPLFAPLLPFCLPCLAVRFLLWNLNCFLSWYVFDGLGIPLPKHLVGPMYDASRWATRCIVDSIRGFPGFEPDVHDNAIRDIASFVWSSVKREPL